MPEGKRKERLLCFHIVIVKFFAGAQSLGRVQYREKNFFFFCSEGYLNVEIECVFVTACDSVKKNYSYKIVLAPI